MAKPMFSNKGYALGGGNGAPGKSAYEIAVDNGFEGTEEAWLASLKGPKGDRGATGATGPAGETGPQGSKGDKGDKGDAGARGADGVSVTGATSDGTNITFTLSNGETVAVPWPTQA